MAFGKDIERLARSLQGQRLERMYIKHYLMEVFQLDEAALKYVAMAEHEAQRVAEITQQTLRFYRQSTLPARANMGDLLDSVLSLYQGRLNTLNIKVERDYDAQMDLFCFAGEVRQVFANLVGNAIDATTAGGRLLIRARRSRNWKSPGQQGVRFVVADTQRDMVGRPFRRPPVHPGGNVERIVLPGSKPQTGVGIADPQTLSRQ